MKPLSIMVIAGEPSGDLLAAELIRSLRLQLLKSVPTTSDSQPIYASLAPRFFGAGGPQMRDAGVDVVVELTRHSAIGPTDVARQYLTLRRYFHHLLTLAIERQPDVILLVDYSHFNHQFAKAVRARATRELGPFRNWNPAIVKYVSPQVWASRPGRAKVMARDFDLLLCLFPFEQSWFAQRVPALKVVCVGHPLLDRYPSRPETTDLTAMTGVRSLVSGLEAPGVVVLPGSREGELMRHLPVMIPALEELARRLKIHAMMVLPNTELERVAAPWTRSCQGLVVRVGKVAESLLGADLAIASTGSVTLECAYFQVPTVAIYKTSWLTFQLGKRLIQVKFLAMPNLLAEQEVMPELIQDKATPKGIADAAFRILTHPKEHAAIRKKLSQVTQALGGPGASRRAAEAIDQLLKSRRSSS